MLPIKRRQFLHFSASTLTTFGLSQLNILRQGNRYGKVLAQGTPGRKLALLVGINGYQAADVAALKGCITDTQMQQELLVNRFGFNPKDILILTDLTKEKPTRQVILTAFEEHLIKQAQPGDIVVFHFSGHGSRVKDIDCDAADCLNSTLVPSDYSLPDREGQVQDIMGHTLFLLMKALKTDNVTVVLDSCYSGGGKRGNVIVRSREIKDSPFRPLPAEIEYQQQWLSKLKLSEAEFKQQRKTGIARGVVITSAKHNQEAADAPFSDFYAGAFTYLMTRYLWQQTSSESVSSAIANIGRSTTSTSSNVGNIQEPEFESKLSPNNEQSPIYFVNRQTPSAEAVVTEVTGKQIKFWLGGVDSQSLSAFEQDAIFTWIDVNGHEQGLVQLDSRTGLVGQGRLIKAYSLKPFLTGALLQERVRGIPSNLTLRIGLDPSLGKSTEQAKQALQAIKRIEPLPLQQEEVQYILGRITDTYRRILQQNKVHELPEIGSVGLFLPNLTSIVPGSFGKAEETVTDGVKRLQAKLKSLLAAHIVKLVLNPGSSKLKVAASLMLMNNTSAIVAQSFTVRGGGSNQAINQPTPIPATNSKQLHLGQKIQFQIQNNEDHNLYVSVLVINPDGEIDVIFPNNWTAAEDATLIGAGQLLRIPDSKDSFTLSIEATGIGEALILASRTPLRKALKALQTTASGRGLDRGPVPLDEEPIAVMSTLLDDLNENRSLIGVEPKPGVYGVDTSQLAALSITFEVIE
ncbi:MAG: caspase family protein [Chroococcidiopsidaceae cyanobacterium CP_BM_ER_R8_30]|nr:caspase family protein [Chroococcidiopsidaceae cyanobacterium CP_BM_ER_R8_30]